EPLKRLKMLEDEIIAAEIHLQHLRRDRGNLLKSIQKSDKSQFPARSLPHDVLREIFIFCLPEDHLPTLSRDDAPVLLTRICSAWKGIALTTPRLW
ncbi:hypothetical protein BDN70DRAFT_774326, partial [Pholiota conissans]